MRPLTILLIGSLYEPKPEDFTYRRPLADLPERLKRPRNRQPRQVRGCKEGLQGETEAAVRRRLPGLRSSFCAQHWRIMVGVPLWEQWSKRETVAPHVLAGANTVKSDDVTVRTPSSSMRHANRKSRLRAQLPGRCSRSNWTTPISSSSTSWLHRGSTKQRSFPTLPRSTRSCSWQDRTARQPLAMQRTALSDPCSRSPGSVGQRERCSMTCCSTRMTVTRNLSNSPMASCCPLTATWSDKVEDEANRKAASGPSAWPKSW